MKRSLRPHQVDVLTRLKGKRRPLVVMGTGLGKTFLAVEFVRQHIGPTLWLAHRDELVDQAKETLAEADVDATVTTVQSLLSSGERPPAKLLVVDEAHHYVSEQWRLLPTAYPDATILGLTATPSRPDGVGLGEIFDCIIPSISVKEATKRGLLVPAVIRTTKKPLPSGAIAQRPVDAHVRGRRAICFSPNAEACKEHAAQFTDAGYRAEVISGTMPANRRRDILAEFKAGKIDCLVSIYVLTEGFDATICDEVIIARRITTAATYLQMIGRGLRPHPGKTDCLLLDLTGMVNIHGPPDEDKIYSLDGLGIRRASDVTERYCPICGIILGPLDVVCPDCGREPVHPTPSQVTGEKLEKFIYRPRATDEEKIRKLRGWYRVQRERGYKASWPIVRFRVEFGTVPPGHMIKEAIRG